MTCTFLPQLHLNTILFKGRLWRPSSVSSLETTNWSRGPEWWQPGYFDASPHMSWSRFHRGGRENTQISARTVLPSCEAKKSLFMETSQIAKKKKKVGWETWNNYKHLLLKHWKIAAKSKEERFFCQIILIVIPCEASASFLNIDGYKW